MTRRRPAIALRAAVFLVLAVAAGCARGTSPSGNGPRLRIANIGPAPVENLVVMFPQDQIGVSTSRDQ